MNARIAIDRLGASLLITGTLFGSYAGGVGIAHAAPLCEHRSAAHVAEHGGIHEDSRWHVSRGELPNCDEDKGSDHSDDDRRDDDGSWRRDDFGFHCTWHGCG